ncbi:MAG TPA: putative glycoside hydrolase [Anaerolineae bacterium]
MSPMLKKVTMLVSSFVLLIVLAGGVLLYRMNDTRQLAGVIRDSETQAPLEGATVSAGNDRVVTNDRGEYSISFPRGTLPLAVEFDGYLPVEGQVNGTDPFARAFTMDLDLIPNQVAGYVLDAQTNQTLGNVAVRFGDKDIIANEMGAFAVRGVKKGTPVSVQVIGYQPAALTYDGEDYLNIPLIPSAITVTVVDLAGQPVPNARVQAGDQSVSTDAQGRGVLSRIKPGVTISASASGFDSASTGPVTGNAVRLSLRPNILDGVVMDAATGKPISNTIVYLGNTIVTSNAKGTYHFDNVPAKATVTFKAPGYQKTAVEVAGASRRDVKLQPFLVKGIHIPFGLTPDRVREDIDMVKKTELNAIVIDVKAEKGRVGWDSAVPLAKEINATWLKGIDLLEVVERCRLDNIYCIARMPVFQDTLLANARPDLALRYSNGRIHADNNETAWTNAANTTVWDYNIALAKEVAALGFDEIQFDYVRFPGQVNGLYTGELAKEDGRVAAISGFLARAQKELRPTGVFISADVFGLTTATDDDQYTGQRLKDLGPYLDYISPMVYPDVWAASSDLLSGGLGIGNCALAVRCPYDVIYNSYKRSAEKTSAKVRLWLQAYAGRGNFGIEQYKIQKKAAEEAGSTGWMFWNAAGSYDPKMFDAR